MNVELVTGSEAGRCCRLVVVVVVERERERGGREGNIRAKGVSEGLDYEKREQNRTPRRPAKAAAARGKAAARPLRPKGRGSRASDRIWVEGAGDRLTFE
jgi:hypothetical protein